NLKFPHTSAAPTPYTTLYRSDNALSNVASIDVAVANVAPTVTLSGVNGANEGDTKHYTFTTSDPGADTFTLVATSGGSVGTISNLAFNGATGPGTFDVKFANN